MSISGRLKEERLRLGLSQTAFAELAGATKSAQIKWERGTSAPTAPAFSAWAEAGADVLYILTGKRESSFPDLQHQDVQMELSEIKEDLIDPNRKYIFNETKEQTEERVLSECRKKLIAILNESYDYNLTDDLTEQAKSLLDILNKPNGVELFRAADYAQGYERRSEEWELLSLWLNNWPYQPSDPVMKLMVMMSIDYGVPHRALVELSQEIYQDIEEQRWADNVTRLHDSHGKADSGGD